MAQVFVNRAGLSAAEGSRCECSAIYGWPRPVLRSWTCSRTFAHLELRVDGSNTWEHGCWQNVSFCLMPRHHIFLLLDLYQLYYTVGYIYLFKSRFANPDYDTWGSTAKRGVLAFYLHFWWQYMTKEFVLDIFTLFWTRLDKRQCGTVRDGAGRCGIWRISFPRDCVMVNGFFLGQFFKIKTRFQLLQLISKRERGRWRR